MCLVVGIGNRYRGDDGAGWRVVEALEGVLPKGMLLKVRGELTELLDLLQKEKRLFVIDACIGEGEGWERIDLLKEGALLNVPLTSTHGFSLKEAIELAKELGQVPSKLMLFAIYAKNLLPSEGLSESVVRSVDEVKRALLQEEEIQACMR